MESAGFFLAFSPFSPSTTVVQFLHYKPKKEEKIRGKIFEKFLRLI
jgi:hypothetical protein